MFTAVFCFSFFSPFVDRPAALYLVLPNPFLFLFQPSPLSESCHSFDLPLVVMATWFRRFLLFFLRKF